MNIKNMALLTLVIIITISVSLSMGCDPVMEAKEGTIIVCKTCKATIADNTRTIKTVRSEIENFRVKTEERICDNCIAKEMSDPQYVANNFFRALMTKNITEAQKYCESSIIDDQGVFGLWGLTYDSNYVCSGIAARMDDQWIKCNILTDDPDGKELTIGDSKVNYTPRMYRNTDGSFKDYYINNKKILSARCLVFLMHQANGQWKFYKISRADGRIITEIQR